MTDRTLRLALIAASFAGLAGLAGLTAGCGDDAPECRNVAAADFEQQSGWEDPAYAPRTTDLGCYPFRAAADETFGDFISMRTSDTASADVGACVDVLTAINCGTYSNGSDELSFFVRDADRLSVEIVGTLQGRDVDTVAYFNPCQPGCLSFVTLETITDDAQKICDIPAQGLATCLFPETAHSLTLLRAGADGVELRIAGEALPVLERQ
jgi:hypothetical protein